MNPFLGVKYILFQVQMETRIKTGVEMGTYIYAIGGWYRSPILLQEAMKCYKKEAEKFERVNMISERCGNVEGSGNR